MRKKSGDYCRQQHELIHRMGGFIEELLKAEADDVELICFMKAWAYGIRLEYDAYNRNYQTWLEARRQGRIPQLPTEESARIENLLRKYEEEHGQSNNG